jgi:hypothetical protein
VLPEHELNPSLCESFGVEGPIGMEPAVMG